MPHRIVPDIVGEQDLCVLPGDASVREAAKLMADRHIGAVMVGKDGRLEGIFTERDLTIRIVARGRDPEGTKLWEVMTKDPDTASPSDTPASALKRMRDRGFRHLPVVNGKQIVAIVSVRDLYANVNRELENDVRDRDAFIFGVGHGGLA
ncbi:MAG: CBS domain-containing protein [Alphaproteobacteria bacterium]